MTDPLPARLSAPRLELRAPGAADVTAVNRLVTASAEHLRPWMPWMATEPRTPAERLRLFEEWERQRLAGEDATYGLFLDGMVVGLTGVHSRIGPGGFEIGYWVGVAHTRRGFASEATAVLTAMLLARRGVDRVEIHHDVANETSGRIPLSLGYELVERRAKEPTAPSETGVECVWRITSAATRGDSRPGPA